MNKKQKKHIAEYFEARDLFKYMNRVCKEKFGASYDDVPWHIPFEVTSGEYNRMAGFTNCMAIVEGTATALMKIMRINDVKMVDIPAYRKNK